MKVFLVTWGDYDGGGVLGGFTTRAAAEAYRQELLLNMRKWDTYEFEVEEFKLDPPRDQLPGQWLVRVDAEGQILSDDCDYFATAFPLPPARTSGGRWEGGVQAWGVTEQAAFAKAVAFLKGLSG